MHRIAPKREGSVQDRRARQALIAASGLLALVLALAWPLIVSAAGLGTLAVVRAGGAELSDAPEGKVLQELPAGAALTATRRTADGEWVLATTPDGASGWIPTARLVVFGVEYLPVASDWQPQATQPTGAARSVTAEASIAMTGTVTTVDKALNVRAGPGTDYPIVGTQAPGATLALIGRDVSSDWLQIAPASGDEIGWVAARYVRVEGDPARLPVSDQVGAAPAVSGAPAQVGATAGLVGKLVFQATIGGTIYLYDLASGTLRSLTTGADPAISPDGKTVAFWRQDGGEYGLYLIDIAGGAERRVLARPERVRGPTWSPDGRSIAFSHVNGQEACRYAGYGICLPDIFPYNLALPLVQTDRWHLAAVNLDGSEYRDIPSLSGAASPDWGSRGLLYTATGIQVTQDGGGADANVALLHEFRYQDPAWQPNGDRIVFQSLEKDHWEIFAATAQGANPTALTRPATTLAPKLPQNVAPAWSPDGHAIAFLSDRSGKWAIWVMDSDGSNQRMLPINVIIEYRNEKEQVLSWGR